MNHQIWKDEDIDNWIKKYGCFTYTMFVFLTIIVFKLVGIIYWND